MKKNQTLKALLLLLPSFIFLFIFTVFPIFQSIYMSMFQDKIGIPQPIFYGFENYRNLMEDEIFWKVMKNNIIFSCTTVPISMVFALALAIFLDKTAKEKKLKGIGLLRTSFFYPTVIPMIAAANIWLFIYTPDFGMLDQALNVFGIQGINWLGNEKYVMLAMIIMNIWKETGYLMIFYLAGLQNVPEDLYEAATIDRANGFQMFKYITLPMIAPTSLFVFVIALTNSFKMVDHLEIMTQGGPNNSSNLLLYYIYEVAFKFWDNGKAAALTVVMLIIMMLITVLRFYSRDNKIHYN